MDAPSTTASTTRASAAPPDAVPARAVRLQGESAHDRVTAILMALVLGALSIFGWLNVVYLSQQAYAARVAAPVEIIDVYGGGGGSPEGEVGETETINIPGAEAAEAASNNEADAAEFEEPSVQYTPSAMIDSAVEAAEAVAELAPAMPTGGPVSGGTRASRVGTGKVGFGFGPGDGGVRKEDRWSILFNPGQTLDEYARQLDALQVELATVNGPDTLIYASGFSGPRPRAVIRPASGDDRLYFGWQGRGRKASDVALLQKAGIEVGDRPILQFYPASVEDRLERLEVAYRGRRPSEIRVTRFRVVPSAGSYDFEVIDQQTLH